ncbi:MAG: cation transporter [Verrucomicrobiota bacterium]
MKSTLLLTSIALLSFGSLQAETLTLEGVHNCCKKCEKGISDAVSKVDGATATADKGTVTITAKDADSAKKAVASLVEGGYFGKGAEAPAVTDATVKTASVAGVHLCCGKCVTAVENAVKSVKGVTSHNAEKGASSFNVEGEFSTKELAAALNKAGFNGSLK